MLHVECGPFASLEKAFLNRLSELKSENPFAKIAIVAPSRRMADRLQTLVALEAGIAALNVHFHTFHSLALSILQESDGAKITEEGKKSRTAYGNEIMAGQEPEEFAHANFQDKTLVGDPVFHDRLLDSLLDKHPDLAGRFGGAARPRALASALRSSLKDLIDAGVDSTQVKENFEDALGKFPRLRRLLDLQEAYQAWQKRHKVFGSSALPALAAEAAEDSEFLATFQEIIYYGFYDLTGLQLEFFESVASAFPSTLYFPYVPDHPAYRFAKDFFELKLHHAGAPKSLEVRREGDGIGGSSRNRDSALTKEKLAIFSASGVRDEAWRVSKEIQKLRRGGVAFDDIGVVARTLEPYRNAIREVFEADAVPFDMPEAGPLKRYPLARFCLDLMTLRRRDFPAHAVSDLIESPYLEPEVLGPRFKARWGRIMDKLGVAAGWLVWQGRLKTVEDAGPALRFLAELREALAPAGVKTWAEWSAYTIELISSRLEIPKSPLPLAGEGTLTPTLSQRERGTVESEQELWAQIREMTESLAGFDPLGGVRWDFFLETWIEKMESAQLEIAQRRGVRVMDAMDARGQSFRVLFLLGVQEGLFPRQVREDPLLRDEDRAWLKHPCGYWISRKLAGYEEERLLFHLLVSSAREKFYAVYSRSDEDGKAQSPSIYLRELCRSVGASLEEAAESVPRQTFAKLDACDPLSLNPREATLRLLAEEGDTARFLDKIGADGAYLTGAMSRLQWFHAGGKAGPMDGITEPPKEYLKELSRKGLSPSALDDFGQCPFRFFAKRVLGLEEEEDEAELGDFSASLRGKIYHAVLERYHKGKGKITLAQAVDEVFALHHWQDVGLYPVVWKSVKAEMEDHLQAFVAWDEKRIAATGLVPAWLERDLRGRIDLPSLPEPLRALEFHGRTDRVDLDSKRRRFQVVDYKTRWPAYKGSVARKVLGGRMHQPAVYAELSFAELGKWKLEGSNVYAIEDGGEEARRLQDYSGEDWQRDRPAVLSGIASYVDMIARGRFPIHPDDGEMGYCHWCSFSSICRKSHRRSRDRAEAELGESTYREIHERKPPRA